jgi:hypothetical protein
MASTEHRHFLIHRFDHYYDSINNKANLFLGINIFLIGGLFTALAILPSYLKEETGAIFWIILMLGLNITSMLFTLFSLLPYAKTCGESMVYFGDISRIELKTFLQKFAAQDTEQVSADLDQQIYYLALGLAKKFKNLSIAGIFFFIEAIVLLPLIITVIKNLK